MHGAKPLTVGAAALVAAPGLLVACHGDDGSHPASPEVRLAAPGPALPAPPVSDGAAPPCGPADLDIAVEAFDRATGNGWASLRAVNRTTRACTLSGAPPLTLDQDGPLLLVIDHGSGLLPAVDAPAELRLEPRASAAAQLAWRGYGAAADTTTPQTVGVGMADGSVVIAIPGLPGFEAPFDVIDGAAMTVGPWQPLGYGPPRRDEPPLEPGAWGACLAEDLVASVDGPQSLGSGAQESQEPTGRVWLTHIGLRPCVVPHEFSLARASGGSVAARLDDVVPGRDAALRPGDAVSARLPWSDIEPVLAEPTQWSAQVGHTGGGSPFVVDGGPGA
ncbi:DUF4232 domain-containing protein [Cellulomonas dongxiuzhuiae]|uniref:DUF4232 domain-containing protein n=1 Tax=Cellulomonas dongxiuzhuiae TaxID=2819979 RepID=A0ABX8GMK6_9CELL|nr:DUF4232 domain-containing protein [Cellulomonas dongxiuzhuiae]MBO3095494.1 DUF4232 domain-containing protein [Cellulomonas dongxiuzhuiae]QWC16474.1 DUF4232 domain-containing protein [Cellulomonas dongxiuzhuiae]